VTNDWPSSFSASRAYQHILDMHICNGVTIENIFSVLDDSLKALEILWQNIVGFDNCNVMIGSRKYVLTRIKEKQPNIFNIGCTYHLENLCLLVGMKTLSVSVDDFFVYLYLHFAQSVKRREILREF